MDSSTNFATIRILFYILLFKSSKAKHELNLRSVETAFTCIRYVTSERLLLLQIHRVGIDPPLSQNQRIMGVHHAALK